MRIAFLLAALACLSGCAGTLAPEKAAQLIDRDLYGQVTSVIDARAGGFILGSNYCNAHSDDPICKAPDSYDVARVMLVRDSWGAIFGTVPVPKTEKIAIQDIIEYRKIAGESGGHNRFRRVTARSGKENSECRWDGSTLFTSGGVICTNGYSYKNLPFSGPL